MLHTLRHKNIPIANKTVAVRKVGREHNAV